MWAVEADRYVANALNLENSLLASQLKCQKTGKTARLRLTLSLTSQKTEIFIHSLLNMLPSDWSKQLASVLQDISN